MQIKLDEYDKKLLFELDKNSRQGYTELAKKLKLSKDTIKYRINNHLKNGLIDGFYALINSSKLGFYSIRVYFNFKEMSNIEEEKAILELKKSKHVFYISKIEGEYEFGIGYFCKSFSEFQEFWNKFKMKFPNKILNERAVLFLSLTHFNRNYFSKSKTFQKKYQIINEPSSEKIDEKNLKILNFLSKNARMPIVEICEKIGLTPKAVILRIKEMEKRGIILGYKTKLNLEKINISMYKVDINVKDIKKVEEVKKFIFELPNIIHYEKTLGYSDLEFDIECEHFEKFEKLIDEIKNRVGKNITSIKHYRTVKVFKTIYFPEI